MKQEKEMMEVTPEEKDLIESIRNYNKSFPDGYPELLWFAQQLFDNMLRQPYQVFYLLAIHLANILQASLPQLYLCSSLHGLAILHDI